MSVQESSGEPVGYWEYGWAKCKRQPLVPIGVLATCIALMGATSSLRKGNREQFNKYLRFRVAAQGVTVVAAVAGTYFLTNKPQQIADSRTRALTNQLPVDPDSIISSSQSPVATTLPVEKRTSDTVLPAAGAQTTASSNSDYSRTRVSQAMRQTDKALSGENGSGQPGGSGEKVKRISEFGKRLEEAERLEREGRK